MSRPRKDQEAPHAQQKLIDAFWSLLEDNRLHELTVGVIAAEAQCNRGTFYYHFDDFDALVFRAIESELMGDGSIPNAIFDLLSGAGEDALTSIFAGRSMRRLSLMMKRGGMDMVEEKTKRVVINMWRTVLCPDGSELAPETRFIVEYMASGMLGILAFKSREDAEGRETPLPRRFMSEVATFAVGQISIAQDVAQEEIVARLHLLSRFRQLSNG